MKNTTWFLALAVFAIGFFTASGSANSSLVVREWFFGFWDCNIDGRPAKMQWYTVNDPQTTCDGDICSSTSGVKVVGRFSDNGTPWVPLAKRWSRNSELAIRYLGNEQDNWYLNYNSSTRSANGWTTWRGKRYSLQCRKINQ
ncbi:MULTISPECIES: DUF6006 family protein [Nostocales]|uniref:Uncharacterized protein n=3 Tax=Nostocales TaxID=1161 RepID=A0A0C1R551_9CYAN|nr:DUF6006 family protein [Tolypothrix bouteillei]KAF3886943.1 hypothetical protein DA73_0400016710 [Tolypothrix bouteillei VB521301]